MGWGDYKSQKIENSATKRCLINRECKYKSQTHSRCCYLDKSVNKKDIKLVGEKEAVSKKKEGLRDDKGADRSTFYACM